MSAQSNDPSARVYKGYQEGKKSSAPVDKIEPATPVAVRTEPIESPRPSLVMSELDSYVHQRMASQPQSVEGVVQRVESLDPQREWNRLSLPDYFERLSYDCTYGQNCRSHANGRHGPYVFRWIYKNKTALDRALDVLGWTLINRVYFPDSPSELFTANGGVERGDAICAFIHAETALAMRLAPGERSQRALKQRLTQVDTDYVLMTGDPKNQKYYQPKLGTETPEEAAVRPGEVVQGPI